MRNAHYENITKVVSILPAMRRSLEVFYILSEDGPFNDVQIYDGNPLLVAPAARQLVGLLDFMRLSRRRYDELGPGAEDLLRLAIAYDIARALYFLLDIWTPDNDGVEHLNMHRDAESGEGFCDYVSALLDEYRQMESRFSRDSEAALVMGAGVTHLT